LPFFLPIFFHQWLELEFVSHGAKKSYTKTLGGIYTISKSVAFLGVVLYDFFQ